MIFHSLDYHRKSYSTFEMTLRTTEKYFYEGEVSLCEYH